MMSVIYVECCLCRLLFMLSVIYAEWRLYQQPHEQTDRQTDERVNSQIDGQTEQAVTVGIRGLLTLYSDVVVDAVGVHHPGVGDDGGGAGVQGESVGNTLAHLVLGANVIKHFFFATYKWAR